ncbi:hypothetical protein [Streptomyces sp. NBC_00299]|uniref:hypothetical protein n=1 Tax=Streptomyces sp. NBC_00299 TaxID=2975705 RepID=UPI002E2C1E19|nr:hypothetical protein [Streptomyces sp. NBC_00299]
MDRLTRRPTGRRMSRGTRRPRLALGSPLKILLLAGSFALAGYAGVRLLDGDWFGIVLWFVGAAILHDLVLAPLYGAADRGLLRGFEAVDRRSWMPYVRVPAALSLLLLLVWFPLITGRVADRYAVATGLSTDGFLARWLLITAALFGGSAVLLVLRRRRG